MAGLNLLVRDLAAAGETAALVRVWDLMGGRAGATEATWRAVEGLHALGEAGRAREGGEGVLRLPPCATRALAPERRLHKICKGRVSRARSERAGVALGAALAWLEAQRAAGRSDFLVGSTGVARRALAKELRRELRVDREAARGLVTKLKQMRKL